MIENLKIYVEYSHGTDNEYWLKMFYKNPDGESIYRNIEIVVEFGKDGDEKRIKVIEYRFFNNIYLTAKVMEQLSMIISNNEQRLEKYIETQEEITNQFDDRKHLMLI